MTAWNNLQTTAVYYLRTITKIAFEIIADDDLFNQIFLFY